MNRREWGNRLKQDVVFASRLARRDWTSAAVALLTFTLGIGATTAVYSVVHGVVLRPLPFGRPDRLAAIWPTRTISNAELEYLQANARTFGSVAAFSPGWGIAMTGVGEPRQLDAARVSTNFFRTLAVRPAIGRGFNPDESEPGKWSVVVLSHELWAREFDGDTSAIGRVVDMDGEPHRVIGIMPAAFDAFQRGVDAWLPLQIDRASQFYRGQTALAFGRLAPRATTAAATAELAMLAPRMRQTFNYTEDYARGATVVDLHENMIGDVKRTMFILLGAVALLVAIAGVNIGNLLLVHAVGRGRELTIRRALGASRAQLAQQLLVQGLLLAIAGGAAGIGAGWLGLQALKNILPSSVPMLAAAELDVRVLIASAACTLGMGVLVGMAPAILATRVDPEGVLRAGSAGRGMRSASSTRRALVILELAVAMMLVVGAGLMTDSLWRLARVDLGFRPENVLTFRLQPSSGQVSDPLQTDNYFRQITARLAAEPGVVSVGAVQHLPLSGFNWSGNLDIESKPIPTTAAHPRVTWRSVTGDYFGAMRIPLLRGREFTTADRRDAPAVVIINEAMARQFWPGADPLGQRIKLANGTRNEWATIVGVVGDVRFNSADTPPTPEAYRPNAQQTLAFMHYVVRTRRSPLEFAPEIRSAVRALDSTVPIAEVRALADLVASSVKTRRSVALLLSSFAVLGLALGAVGIYGVMSFGVSQRTREIGIRSALGARRRTIMTTILGEGVRLAATGIAIGAIGALVGAQSLRSLVYGIGTAEPAVYAIVAALLGLVALAATLIPARRAAQIDPVIALRGE